MKKKQTTCLQKLVLKLSHQKVLWAVCLGKILFSFNHHNLSESFLYIDVKKWLKSQIPTIALIDYRLIMNWEVMQPTTFLKCLKRAVWNIFYLDKSPLTERKRYILCGILLVIHIISGCIIYNSMNIKYYKIVILFIWTVIYFLPVLIQNWRMHAIYTNVLEMHLKWLKNGVVRIFVKFCFYIVFFFSIRFIWGSDLKRGKPPLEFIGC